MSKGRIGPAEKLRTVYSILGGKEAQCHAATRLGISLDSIQQWMCVYMSDGEGTFHATKNKRYSKGLKE